MADAQRQKPAQIDFKAFDADNHYYEALDAFIRLDHNLYVLF